MATGGIVEAAAAEVVGDPSWFVDDYDSKKDTLSFVRANRAVLAAQPFLDHRWNRAALERRELSLDALAARMPREAEKPRLNFIWHTSFCCSTLIAEAIDLPGRNLSLREPLVLVSTADAKRSAAWKKEPPPQRLIETVFSLLARTTDREEQTTIKPSNYANVLIEDAQRLSRGKALFLYADLENFLISLEKGGEPLRKYARRLFGNIAGDSGGALPLPPQEIFQLSDLEIAALAWHMQIAHFRRTAPLFAPGEIASLDSDVFLADPATTLASLDRYFEVGMGQDRTSQVVSGPLFKRHAKNPSHPFDADERRTQADAVRKRLGENLHRIVEWSYRIFPDAPRHAPLSPVPGL